MHLPIVSSVAVLLVACQPPIYDARSVPLPRSSLAAEGLDATHWDNAIAEIRERDLPVDSLLVTRGGQLVAEHHRPPYDRTALHDLRSSTKSITSLLVGQAIDRGLIASVDEPVQSFFPERTPPPSWSEGRALRIEDLLTMQSGLDCNDSDDVSRGNEERMYGTNDWIGFFFDLPRTHPPGARFSYCTAGVVVLGEIVARVAERPLPDVAEEWLFGPLGIHEARWDPAPGGVTDAGGHLELSAESLSKVALLALNRGRHDGEQLVSEGYIDAMLDVHTTLVPEGQPGPRYGYLFWLEPVVDGEVRSFQTRGNGGQFAFAFPRYDAVITFTGHAYNDDAAQAAFFEVTARHLIPLVHRGAP
ncbi:MAG: serine hydrolase domain-containing protein [Sandaracinaceae bacterium]